MGGPSFQILLDPAHGWETCRYGDWEAHLKGAFWNKNELFSGERGCAKLHSLFRELEPQKKTARLDSIRHVLACLDGNFAFILHSKNIALACVDHVRSYPLFYTLGKDGVSLSWSAQTLKTRTGLNEIDETAKLEFLMSGYVSGSKTLYRGLQQLQGGEFLFYTEGSRDVVLERYCAFFSEDLLEGSEEDLLHETGIRHERTFAKMIQALGGRQVCVPLSAGLDSRLVLGFLMEHQYDNVLTYTYGRKSLWEVTAARAIAKKAGVAWIHVDLHPNQVKDHTYSKKGFDYFRFASGLASVPFITENYALAVLQANGKLEADCVLVNGQSGDFTTGGHAPVWLLQKGQDEMKASALLEYAVDRHYSLWRDLKTKQNLKTIQDTLSTSLGLSEETVLSGEQFIKQYELLEWQERQCKYVVNGQRLYDWLGYDWLLPLWDMELFTFWREVPWQYKVGQRLYKQYLQERDPGGLFNIESPRAGKNDIPTALLAPQVLYQLFAKALGFDRDWFKRTFVNYFWVHSPYYPQRSYLEFLKDSSRHRNYLSYLARVVLGVLCAPEETPLTITAPK